MVAAFVTVMCRAEKVSGRQASRQGYSESMDRCRILAVGGGGSGESSVLRASGPEAQLALSGELTSSHLVSSFQTSAKLTAVNVAVC